MESWLPDQGENTHRLHWKAKSFNQGTTKEVLIFDIDFYIVEQGETCYILLYAPFSATSIHKTLEFFAFLSQESSGVSGGYLCACHHAD